MRLLELEKLNTELTNELLKLDDELDLLLELEATIVIELAELATKLSAELNRLELDSELDLLLKLLGLDDMLLKLELILLDVELVVVCKLAELDATTMIEELLWELSLDELEKRPKDTTEENPSEEGVKPMLDDIKELDKEDAVPLDDKDDDKDDDLNTATDELATVATEALENALLSPPPPPQAFKKATAKHPQLNLSTREDLEGCI